MALSEAILICLTERPMSGYDLAKTFDASIGFFWRASHQQIYRELGKLREKGFVKSQEITQSGKPNRIVHTITKKGRTHLKSWSAKPNRLPSTKDELLVKFYALEGVDLGALKEQVMVRLEEHQSRLARFQHIKERYYAGKDLTLNQQGKLMVLEMGLEDQARRIKWWENALVRIAEFEKQAR